MIGIWKALSSRLRLGKGYEALNNNEGKDQRARFTGRAECKREQTPNLSTDTQPINGFACFSVASIISTIEFKGSTLLRSKV